MATIDPKERTECMSRSIHSFSESNTLASGPWSVLDLRKKSKNGAAAFFFFCVSIGDGRNPLRPPISNIVGSAFCITNRKSQVCTAQRRQMEKLAITAGRKKTELIKGCYAQESLHALSLSPSGSLWFSLVLSRSLFSPINSFYTSQ